jgi:Asp-tRNA(Asn)/Glu-tRNA(Gln) amidotransferase A subunit family amidase
VDASGRWWRPWSLRELVGELTAGTTTPADVLERSRARIRETEPDLRAWVVLDPAPDVTGSAGPLGGVPLGVKDIVDVTGLPTRCGTPLRADAAPARTDASVVAAWRRAGAVPIGKTVTTEFASFAPSETRNPAAADHTPGGSSSGSAAAVASGQVPLALGTQTAGSVTRPASFCGIAALATSHGRFPADGMTGFSPSLDTHGFYAAGVSDLALAWSALTGTPDRGLAAARPPRLLLWSPGLLGALDPALESTLASIGDRLTGAGAVVDDFPEERIVADVVAAHAVVMRYEAARERAAELAVAEQLSDRLADLLRAGAATPSQEYDAARRTIAAAAGPVAELLGGYDAVVGLASWGPAPRDLSTTGDPVLSRAWQALGLPAVTVPGLRTASGLPLGVQAIGRRGGEEDLLATSRWIETALARLRTTEPPAGSRWSGRRGDRPDRA